MVLYIVKGTMNINDAFLSSDYIMGKFAWLCWFVFHYYSKIAW